MFTTSDGGNWLYDTATWKPIKDLKLQSSDPELSWHPTDPNLFYFLEYSNNSPNVRAMMRYDIRSDQKTLLRDFSEYETVRGKLEGNMDAAGRYYALIGKKGSALQAFVYDVAQNKVSKKLDVTEKMADDWISVTPSGKYVVLMGGDRSRVYDIDMNLVTELPKGSFGHGSVHHPGRPRRVVYTWPITARHNPTSPRDRRRARSSRWCIGWGQHAHFLPQHPSRLGLSRPRALTAFSSSTSRSSGEARRRGDVRRVAPPQRQLERRYFASSTRSPQERRQSIFRPLGRQGRDRRLPYRSVPRDRFPTPICAMVNGSLPHPCLESVGAWRARSACASHVPPRGGG